MIDKTIQKQLLDKILNSKEFQNSEIYQKYLQYLVDAAISGKNIKETTIAIEVFDKDAHFNPAEDTIVRTRTYTLRKKLESYYYNEGREDKYRLRIPKGKHYEAVFVVQTPRSRSKFTFKNLVLKFYYLPILIGLFFLLYKSMQSNVMMQSELRHYKFIDRNEPIWKEYFEQNVPTMIILGDHFVFNLTSEKFNGLIGIRSGRINSQAELDSLQKLYPEDDFTRSPDPYFPYHSIWSLPPLLTMFNSVKNTPVMRQSSDISPQILNEYNTVFVGSIKTLYVLKHTLQKSHFDFKINPHQVIYNSDDNTSPQVFRTNYHTTGSAEDLVLALKLPGPAQNSFFIIASYNSLGAPEISRYLTNPNTLQELKSLLEEKFGYIPKYFELLFRVTGIDKTAYNREILIIDEIKAE